MFYNTYPTHHHVIAGDINGHHYLWDSWVSEDAIGRSIFDWIMQFNDAHEDIGFQVANNALSPTYRHQWTSNGVTKKRVSCPDLALHSSGVNVFDWTTLQGIGGDCLHFPIQFDVSLGNPDEIVRARTVRRRTRVSWPKVLRDQDLRDKFNADFSRQFKRVVPHSGQDRCNIHKMGEWINECFRVAAKGLPRGCRVDPVLWWDEEIDEAIILREFLRSMADEEPGLHLAAFQDQVAAVNTLIRKKKTESWRNFTSTTLRYGLNPAQAAAISST